MYSFLVCFESFTESYRYYTGFRGKCCSYVLCQSVRVYFKKSLKNLNFLGQDYILDSIRV